MLEKVLLDEIPGLQCTWKNTEAFFFLNLFLND